MSLSHHGHPARYGYRFRNDTNEEIICGQGSEKQFWWSVKSCLFVKGNQDQNITQRWTNGQQNIERRKKYQIATYSCSLFLRAKQPLVSFLLCIFIKIYKSSCLKRQKWLTEFFLYSVWSHISLRATCSLVFVQFKCNWFNYLWNI